MKALLCILAFVAITTSSFSQVAFAENNPSKEVNLVSKKLSPKKIGKLRKKQTKSAANQLHTYLTKQLSYSELMAEYCTEGTALVQVHLSANGTILSAEMMESPHPEVSVLVLNTMEQMERLQLKNSTYFGVKKLRIPIHFSLR